MMSGKQDPKVALDYVKTAQCGSSRIGLHRLKYVGVDPRDTSGREDSRWQ